MFDTCWSTKCLLTILLQKEQLRQLHWVRLEWLSWVAYGVACHFIFFFQPFALMQKRWSSMPSERRLCLSRPQTSIIPSHAEARFCKCKRSSRSGEKKKKKKPRHACGSDRCLQCGISKNAAVGQRDYKNWFHSWGNPILRLNLRNTEWDMFWLQKWFLFKGNYFQPKPASFYF